MDKDEASTQPDGQTVGHVPVLFDEVMTWLDPAPGRTYIDATVGLGGHAEGILERSAPDGRLLALDVDPKALRWAERRLRRYGERVVYAQGRHQDLADIARQHGLSQVQGILLDLGVSSLQIDDPERGFSFQTEGPLDMRMGPEVERTAEEIVNSWPEEELSRIFYEYGEERRARRVARAIVARRPLRNTRAGRAGGGVVGYAGRIHPARTFQALRIAVNDDLASIESVLPQATELLAPGASGGHFVSLS